jgi:hypothetical protein
VIYGLILRILRNAEISEDVPVDVYTKFVAAGAPVFMKLRDRLKPVLEVEP